MNHYLLKVRSTHEARIAAIVEEKLIAEKISAEVFVPTETVSSNGVKRQRSTFTGYLVISTAEGMPLDLWHAVKPIRGVLGWIGGAKPSRQGLFNRVKQECLDAGMRLSQEGEFEGIFVFDPDNPAQAKLAIKSIRVRVKKTISEATKTRLVETLARVRAAKQSSERVPLSA
jgi:transcription antitermination factor NusG